MKSYPKFSASYLTMRPYSKVQTTERSNYTCFTGTRVLGEFEETWSKYPKPSAGTHEKQSKVFAAPHIKSYLTLVRLPCVGCVGVATCFLGTWVLGKLVEIGPKYPQIMSRVQTKSNPQTSALYFRSNETLSQCQRPLWIYFYVPISQVLWNWCNLGNTELGSNTPNHSQGHTKSNPKSSGPHLTSNNVLLLYQGHLRLVLATCLRGIQALGRLGEIRPKYSQIKSYEVTYEK